jgi:hypothetical protein
LFEELINNDNYNLLQALGNQLRGLLISIGY